VYLVTERGFSQPTCMQGPKKNPPLTSPTAAISNCSNLAPLYFTRSSYHLTINYRHDVTKSETLLQVQMLTESRCEVPRRSYAGVCLHCSRFTNHEGFAYEPCSGFLLAPAPAAEFTLPENQVYVARYGEQVQ
jgi:hypothetical protein